VTQDELDGERSDFGAAQPAREDPPTSIDERRRNFRTANAPRVVATLRSTAVHLLRLTGTKDTAKTNRDHARDSARPAKLLLTC
jgi:hypothetical protein